jgi:hypothetical protein
MEHRHHANPVDALVFVTVMTSMLTEQRWHIKSGRCHALRETQTCLPRRTAVAGIIAAGIFDGPFPCFGAPRICSATSSSEAASQLQALLTCKQPGATMNIPGAKPVSNTVGTASKTLILGPAEREQLMACPIQACLQVARSRRKWSSKQTSPWLPRRTTQQFSSGAQRSHTNQSSPFGQGQGCAWRM